MPSLRTDFHIFRAVPQCEAVVCKVLAKRKIETLAPRTEAFEYERVGRSRSRVWTSQPVFPGYVFASIRGAQWGMLRLVPYLHPQPLALDGTPYRLTEADVDCIRSFDGVADPRKPVEPDKYRNGETVCITSGPFERHKATVDADFGAEVHVLVQLFGKMTPYRAKRDWIERAT